MDGNEIDYKQAAKLAKVSTTTIARWVIHGCRSRSGSVAKLIAAKHGGRWYLTTESLTAFLMETNGGMEPTLPPRQPRSMSLADRRKQAKRKHGSKEKRSLPDMRRPGKGQRVVSNLLVERLLPDSHKEGNHRSGAGGVGANAPTLQVVSH